MKSIQNLHDHIYVRMKFIMMVRMNTHDHVFHSEKFTGVMKLRFECS